MRRAGPVTRLFAGAAVGVAVLATQGASRAQVAPAARAAAQALFDQARALTAAGSYAEACPKLDESQRLDPSIGTQFYLADCLEHDGKLASAWGNYIEAADRAKLAGQADRESFARKRAELLAPRLPKLVLTVPAALKSIPGLAVKRDGVLVGPAQWGTPVPVDAGRHAVSASAPGRVGWEGEVTVAGEATTATADIPMLAEAPVAPQPDALGVTPPTPRSNPRLRTAGFVVGGIGVAGIAAGFGVGALALSKNKASGAHCAGNMCDPTGLALRNDAIGAATASTATFVAGAVLLGTGVVLLLVSRPGAPATGFTAGPSGVAFTGGFP